MSNEKSDYKTYPQILAAFTANLTVFYAGISFGWTSPSLPKLLDKSSDLHVSSDEGAWIVTAMVVGACFGPIASALLTDRIGRKPFILLCAVPFLICWIMVYFAKSFEELVAARFISGLSVGAVCAVVPMYVGEIAETKNRGAVGTMIGLMISFGSLAMYSIGPWIDRKTLALINIIPGIIFFLTFPWMPETPYYYLKKNNMEAAEKSLVWLRGSTEIRNELKEMTELISKEMECPGKITELFTVRSNRNASFIIWLLLSAQQFSGLHALLAYMSLLFQRMSLNIDPSIAVIITNLIPLLVNIVSSFVVDKLGRKPLFLLSACGVTTCLGIVGTYFYLEKSGVEVNAISWVPLLATMFLLIFFGLGLGPVVFAILSEIYPTTVKGWALTIAATYGSLVGVLITKGYQIVTDAWGYYAAFYILCVIEAVFTINIYFFLPETKGKSFKEIQEILGGDAGGPKTTLENSG